MSHEINSATELAKAVPAMTASTLILFGYPLTEWVVLGSFLLIALQLLFLVMDKIYRPIKEKYGRRQ